ncbi:MAG: transposase [candidate division Zixibacteria bacterium]|nr:transposase [candidate division Zixibacteria bacterium]MDH3938909.1 transposase [candidate division Zixibacteria bacterium]MDH4034759.1 transposase [candidate division Zixibacteria bacterium]
MSILRRFHSTHSICFITCVTYQRRPILAEHVDLLWTAVHNVRKQTHFEVNAYAILPDHFHLVLDPLQGDFTKIMQRAKMSFGMLFRKKMGLSSGRVWQHRYWDHMIRDQEDMNNHIDYIHYNAVKHGLVDSPSEWEHSSFGKFQDIGVYSQDWGVLKRPCFDGEFGE